MELRDPLFTVKHDEQVEATGLTANEAFAYIVGHQANSVYHATTYEGWSTVPEGRSVPKVLYVVQGYYVEGYGWEDVCAEESRTEAKDRLIEYDENEPEYRHRIVRKGESDE